MKQKICLYTDWDKQDLKCACLFFNPMCDKYKDCEELEVTLDSYEDIEETMRNGRYKSKIVKL